MTISCRLKSAGLSVFCFGLMIGHPAQPALWYKVAPVLNLEGAAWCSVSLHNPVEAKGKVYGGRTAQGEYNILGARRTPAGAELLLENGGEQFIFPNIPVMAPL